MGDLGLQALQSVAGAENPLLRLEELSQNFPSHASALSALKVQPGTREEAQVGSSCGGMDGWGGTVERRRLAYASCDTMVMAGFVCVGRRCSRGSLAVTERKRRRLEQQQRPVDG